MQFNTEDIKTLTSQIASVIEQNKDLLGELDGKSGDGDLGISMHLAFEALKTTSKEYQDTDIGMMLFKMAKACNKAAPSTMGTLISSGVMGMAKAYKGRKQLSVEDIVNLPRIFTNAIMERGKANVGDKTILDALVPYCDALEMNFKNSHDLKSSFIESALVAKNAAKATSGMQAKIGRAKWLGERAAVYPDAGATLWAIIAKSLINDL